MESADSQPPWTARPSGRATPGTTLVGGLPWEPAGQFPRELPTAEPRALPPPAAAAEPKQLPSVQERIDAWVRRSPPLTASLSLHVLVLLFLALVVIREQKPRRLTLDMSFASDQAGEDPGGAVTITPEPKDEQPEPANPAAAAAPAEPPPPPEPDVVPEPTPEVARSDQLAIATPLPAVPLTESAAAAGDQGGKASTGAAPDVSRALSGRSGDLKQALLSGSGGSAETEAAVARALAWLVKKQGRDGLWSLQGPYPDGSNQENKLAATAMALLAFQGAGNTPQAGEHRAAVARGWKTLLASQVDEGVFELGRMPDQHAMYAHAQVTIAVCELFAMTRDETVRSAAERAIGYCVAAQMPDGGWRYRPPQPGGDNKGDMSVTGWFMMALKTAEMGGLQVPAETYARVAQFLDGVFISDAKGYGYQIIPNQKVVQVRPALTAEALLCRQYLGWPADDPRLQAGLDLLFRELPLEFAYPHKNVYAWYYATQVYHHAGGGAWERWNERLRAELPASQVVSGKETGSWDPAHDQWGHFGGRLFMTCLCTYMLEVYYRHLPLAAER